MKRIFIPMSVVCVLVAALLAQPKAEDEKSAPKSSELKQTIDATSPPTGSKQDLDKGFQAALFGTLACCEIPGDANDDGVLNPYDFFFANSYGIQYIPFPVIRVYPEGFCWDQMISRPLASPPGYTPVLVHALDAIRPHLFQDEDTILICGSKGF